MRCLGIRSSTQLGIISAPTPGIKTDFRIKRINLTPEDIASVGRDQTKDFLRNTDVLLVMRNESLSDPQTEYLGSNLDFLWKVASAV